MREKLQKKSEADIFLQLELAGLFHIITYFGKLVKNPWTYSKFFFFLPFFTQANAFL